MSMSGRSSVADGGRCQDRELVCRLSHIYGFAKRPLFGSGGVSRRAGLRESFGLIPHLTVGDCPEGGLRVLRAAEAEVLAALPVRTHVSCAWLMTGT
jgi:hypothetical protein